MNATMKSVATFIDNATPVTNELTATLTPAMNQGIDACQFSSNKIVRTVGPVAIGFAGAALVPFFYGELVCSAGKVAFISGKKFILRK